MEIAIDGGDAARTLGQMKVKCAVEPLIQTLTDEDPEVRGDVTWTLGEIGNIKAFFPLVNALADTDWYVRGSASISLQKIGKPAVIRLIQILNHDSTEVRKEVIKNLGKIDDTRAL